MEVKPTGAERQWIKELIRFSLLTISRRLRVDACGIAFQRSDREFSHFLFDGRSRCIVETDLTLPDLLLKQFAPLPFTIHSPYTSFLPLRPPPASVLAMGALAGTEPLMLFWVGRMRPPAWNEEERRNFETLAESLERIFIPFLPMLVNGRILRSWLKATASVDVSKTFEESLTFLLELVLSAANARDGAIVLTDSKGTPIFGVAQGEDGKRWLEMRCLPVTARQSFTVKFLSEASWMGIIAVKASERSTPNLSRLLEAAAQIIRSLVSWVQQFIRLEKMIWLDPLTNLPNRKAFCEKLEAELNRAARFGYPVSLILADLDEFRIFNQMLGFEAGDEILRQVGSLLRQSVRGYDFVARYGEDEFAIALPATYLEGAIKVAERLKTRLNETNIPPVRNAGITIKVSIGLATVQKVETEDAQRFLALADQALTTAKAKGGNRIEFTTTPEFTPSVPSPPAVPPDFLPVLAQYLSHSINNPLNGILGMAQIALMEEGLPPNVREALERIEQLSLRLREFSCYLLNLPSKRFMEELESFWKRMHTPPPLPEAARGGGL